MDAATATTPIEVEVTSTFQVHQLCCQNAFRDERNETRRYGKRHEMFLEYIREHGFGNIISLKELRNCKDAAGVVRHPLHFIGDMVSQEVRCPVPAPLGARMQLAMLGITKQYATDGFDDFAPFHLAQLYCLNTFRFCGAEVFDYSEEAFGSKTCRPHMGGALLACAYELRSKPGFFFLVESFHAPFDENDKDRAAAWVRDVYPARREARFGPRFTLNIIRTGDFNFFADKPNCVEQEKAYLRGFVEGTREMFSYATGEHVYGTFFPSPDDAYIERAADPYDGNDPLVGRLDRLYYTGAFAARLARVHVPPRAELRDATKLVISDHFPLVVDIEVLA